MVRTFAIVVIVGSLLVSSGCRTGADGYTDTAADMRESHMAVSENTVYYLEIITEDIQVTADFYASAYGWRFESEAPELGNALVATLSDGSLCGIRAPMHDQEKPIVRTYLRVTDLDAAVKQATQLGATVAIESMEIPGRGKIAIFFIGGIEQGLWQLS